MLPPSTQHHLPSTRTPQSPVVTKQVPVVHYFYLLAGLSLLVFVLHKLDDILLPIAFSGLFALLLLPLCRRFESWGMPRILAILVCILLVMLLLAGIVVLFGSQIIQFREELPLLRTKMFDLYAQFQNWASTRFGFDPMTKEELIAKTMKSVQKDAGSYVGSTIATTTGILSVVTLVPIYIFCLLYYRDHMRQFMFRFVAPDKRTMVLNTVDNIQTVVQAYIMGLLTVILIVSLLNAVGLLFLDVKYAIFFAVFASVLAIIPYIGIMIGASIPALITFVETGSPLQGFLVICVFAVVQFLEGNFITPMVTGSKVSINPMAAIVALILGGELWGTPGMILSIPITAVLKVIFDAYQPLEPFGFLLGDVAEGDDVVDGKEANPGFWTKLWWRLTR